MTKTEFLEKWIINATEERMLNFDYNQIKYSILSGLEKELSKGDIELSLTNFENGETEKQTFSKKELESEKDNICTMIRRAMN